ncbi:MAG: hypothetical protein MUO50_18530 [Longimicrobiales bacterium]|nr:hypothetical protein [Longimicrobiales bacterium]
MRFRDSWFALIVWAPLILACSGESAVLCEPLVEGVEVVARSARDAWDNDPDRRWRELWRVGGLRPGQELAEPLAVAVGPDGSAAILDWDLREVLVVESDGTWKGSIFRSGPGPAELRAPVAATWSTEGTLSVFDIETPKVLRYDDADESIIGYPLPPSFTAPIVSSGQLEWAGIQPDGSVLLYPGPMPAPRESDPSLHSGLILRLASGASRPDTLLAAAFPTVTGGYYRGWPVPGWPRPMAAVGAGGRFALGGMDASYRILIYDSTGVPIRQVCGRSDPLPLSDEERGRFEVNGLGELAAAIREAPRPEQPASYGRLVVGADGSLWVQRERQDAYPGAGASLPGYGRADAPYEVFNPWGEYLGSVSLPSGTHLAGALGDTIWTVVVGAFDEVELVAWERGDS